MVKLAWCIFTSSCPLRLRWARKPWKHMPLNLDHSEQSSCSVPETDLGSERGKCRIYVSSESLGYSTPTSDCIAGGPELHLLQLIDIDQGQHQLNYKESCRQSKIKTLTDIIHVSCRHIGGQNSPQIKILMMVMMSVSFVNRFPSCDHLIAFWFFIEPLIYKMVHVSRSKSAAKRNEEMLTHTRPSTSSSGLSALYC